MLNGILKITRGCGSRQTILAMVYKLWQSAQKKWRKLWSFKLLADVIRGVQFKEGERDTEALQIESFDQFSPG